MSVPLDRIVDHLNDLLEPDQVSDASRNGLQIEAGDAVARVALAVDAAGPTIDAAIERDCQLLVVHHGLFWGDDQPLRGVLGTRVGAAFRGGLSLYAAHLPLDLHPEVGNNVLLAQALGATPDATFASHGGLDVGILASLPEPQALAEVAGRLAAAGCDDQRMWAFGPDPIRRVAVLTGSGCSALQEAIDAGADCFITGESRHSAYHQAREGQINCIFAGHYATETFGVRALGQRLQQAFGLETEWIDLPTGI